MKFVRYMYHLNTFQLLKTKDVNRGAAEGASKNPPKNTMNILKSWLKHVFVTVWKMQ